MAILNNNTVTIDAVLTAKGRELLARNDGSFRITQFSLADDEVDYTLYNPQHPSGSAFYGQAIEAMPLIEAFPDDTQIMIYKLVTLPKDVIGIPVISVSPTAVSFTSLKQEIVVSPATLSLAGGNDSLGYTAILADDTVATLEVAADGGVSKAPANTSAVGLNPEVLAANANASGVTSFLDDEVTSVTTAGKTIVRVGKKFVLKPKAQANLMTIKRTLLTIIGNETGGFKTVSVSVDPTNFAALDIQVGLANK